MVQVCHRNLRKLLNFLFLSVLCRCCLCVTFNEVTDVIFTDSSDCVIAAFGDFNSDKLTDIFCLRKSGRTLQIFLTEDRKQIKASDALSCTVDEKEIITSVMPADFNGDSMLDVLITVSKEDSDKNEVRILWGGLEKINCTASTNFTTKSQPLLIDFSGDMIPELFVENENGAHAFWTVKKPNLILEDIYQVESKQSISSPHSCAFVDLNNDLEADLFMTGKDSIEYWYHYRNTERNIFTLSKVVEYPKNNQERGQSIFVDINGDGLLEHVMPVCQDSKCTVCSIVIRSLENSEWKTFLLSDNFKYKNETWCFMNDNKLFKQVVLPVALRTADIDMDGMPDFLTVITNEARTKGRALLLKNVPCSNCPFGRTLIPLWDLLGSFKNVVLATFYDLYEDGIVDILLNTRDSGKYNVRAFQNMLSTDAYFVKVLVVGGLCYDNCPQGSGRLAYGINQPGPFISYKTTGPDGSPRTGAMTQLPQSAHFSLQLPYSIFGLGQTPNFVDELKVVIPGGYTDDLHKRTWTQIIPNSQIVVIPYPTVSPKMWVAKLFVTPSHSILLTFFALVGTCLFICLIIGALHWKERRADRREKLLEAHRFHFDAM